MPATWIRHRIEGVSAIYDSNWAGMSRGYSGDDRLYHLIFGLRSALDAAIDAKWDREKIKSGEAGSTLTIIYSKYPNSSKLIINKKKNTVNPRRKGGG